MGSPSASWAHGAVGGRPEAEVGEVGVYNINLMSPARLLGIMVPPEDQRETWEPNLPRRPWVVTSFVLDGQEQLEPGPGGIPLQYLHKYLENPFAHVLARKSISITFTDPKGIIAWPMIAFRADLQVVDDLPSNGK